MRVFPLFVAAALAACGNSSGGGKDGGGGDDGDGGIDAEPDTMIDADPNVRGPVSVRIIDKNDRPLAGLHVVFIDTDMTVTDLTTDANGSVQTNVYPGASVTAVRARDNGMSFGLTTVLSLNPDDNLTLISAEGAAISGEDPFTNRQVPLPSADVTGGVKSGSNTVFTTAQAHGFAIGDTVVVGDVLPAGYNGTYTVSAVTGTTFTVNYANNTAASGGTAYKATPVTVAFAAYGGATQYEVHTPCDSLDVGAQTSPQVLVRAGCAGSTMDVLVYAKSSLTNEVAYAYQPNVATTGTVNITDTWHTLSTVSATYTNPTAQVTNITTGRFTPFVRGLASVGGAMTASPTTMFDLSTALPPVAWMRSQFECPTGTDCITTTQGIARQTLAQPVDGTLTTYAVDIGANLLPWVSASWLPASANLDVTVTGAQAYDFFEASVRYFRGQSTYTWRVFGPIAGDVTFPTLPATLPGDPTIRTCTGNPCFDTQSGYQVVICDSDAVAGYRDAVKNLYTAIGTCETSSNIGNRVYGGTKNRTSTWN